MSADGRMLKKKISKSRKLAALPSDSDRLFYTWLIPHLDIEGRILADADTLKGDIVPRLKDWSADKVEQTLQTLAKGELIILYNANGDRYLELLRFADEQSLRKDREKASEIPGPDEGEIVATPGDLPEGSRRPPAEVKLREDKIREYVTLSPDQHETLKTRFPEDRLEWMLDKLDYWAGKKDKPKVIKGYGYFRKGSWLIEEMEKYFRQTPNAGIQHDSSAAEEARKEVEEMTPEQRARNTARIRALARKVVGDE